MIFPSYIFLLVFLPAVLFFWYFFKNLQLRLLILTLASYIFYGWWDYRFTILMFASTTLDYICGQQIAKAGDKQGKKFWLLVSLVGNLGALGFFKYYDFFVGSAVALCDAMSLGVSLHTLSIVLPIGISFYTFQSMSYSIDIFRGDCQPAPNYLRFSAYVTMFPQLVAGPIVRYSDVEQQLIALPNKKIGVEDASRGIWLFCLGLFKKILIADRLAPMADTIFDGSAEPQMIGAWIGVLCYTFQLYFDFSGYSDMARGLGWLLGFDFPINFNSPYKSKSIAEFWRRWHITLSNWLRDYLFIPLGGSRVSTANTMRNLGITMFLGGLWHGAAWTFVVWGILHGAYLMLNALWRKLALFRLPSPLAVTLTFLCVVIGWVVFRAPTFERALAIYGGMFGLNGIESFSYSGWYGVPLPGFFETMFYLQRPLVGLLKMGMIPAAIFIGLFMPNTNEIPRSLNPLYAVIFAGLTIAVILKLATATPFLYFQF